MCEFTALASGKILLRLEYDPRCVGTEELRMVQACVPEALGMLAEGVGYEEVKARVLERSDKGWESDGVERDYFGVALRDL